jgi:hypothetical protein
MKPVTRLKLFLDHLIFKTGIAQSQDIRLEEFRSFLQVNSANPLNRRGYANFSQFDEDGIIDEILKRIGIHNGRFLELGVGDGTENNTLNLLTKGWTGLWIGGQPLINPSFLYSVKLRFVKSWITRENISELIGSNTGSKDREFDLISIDLDGNDLEIWKEVLTNFTAKVLVAEYNGRFDSGSEWVMKYDSSHIWKHDAYFGVSFKSLILGLKSFGYTPVATSMNGTNLFLVADNLISKFDDIPSELNDLYNPARNYLFKTRYKVGRRLFDSIVGN